MESLSEEQTLHNVFLKAEETVHKIERGAQSMKDIQKEMEKSIKFLEELTMEVSKLGLFSPNEAVEDIPTSSLPFLLLPCYLGVLQHNLTVDVMEKQSQLKLSQAYYRDFLKRARQYSIIEGCFPWEKECENGPATSSKAESLRQEKVERFKKQEELKMSMQRARRIYDASKGEDESSLREIYLAQINYWCSKLFDELKSIDDELPMIEMMMRRKTQGPSESSAESAPRPSAPLKPFIITRTSEQKKVFGLGYPAIPTMTVDEWYDRKLASNPPPAGTTAGHSHGETEACNSHDEEDSDDENASESHRAQKIRFDEYKDWHRRGWGNTHNKG